MEKFIEYLVYFVYGYNCMFGIKYLKECINERKDNIYVYKKIGVLCCFCVIVNGIFYY